MTEKFSNIRTGVIGIGSMGQNHARVYSEISNFIGVADPDENKGRALASKFGVEWFRDFKDLIGLVDAVSIATPTKYHSEIAIEFASKGVNILVEKPLADSIVNSEKIIKAASKANVVLSVGHIERHNPVVRFMKDNLVQNKLGDLISLSARRLSLYPERILDVGVIFDLLVHDIDIMNYIFDKPPVSIYSLGHNFKNGNNEDSAITILDYGDGHTGICETSWLSPIKVRKMQVLTSNNLALLDFMNQSIDFSSSNFLDLDKSDLSNYAMEMNTRTLNLAKEEPLKNELMDFLQAIHKSVSPLVSGDAGSLMVKIAEASIKSIETGKVIRL